MRAENHVRIGAPGAFLAVVVLCLASLGCPADPPVDEPPAAPPEPLPPLAKVARDYWVEAEGTVSLDHLTVPGKLRMHYLVYDDGRVVVPAFSAWMDDLDWVVSFLWWEVDRERLRCTSFRNVGALEGSLGGQQLSLPAGQELIGASYFERNSKGECRGRARRLEIESPHDFSATHDPDNDYFALDAEFVTGDEGQEVTVKLAVEGQYLNRPPIAALEVTTEGVEVDSGGCPATRKGDPSIAVANTPSGLEIGLRSNAWDPDGSWPLDQSPKQPRVDLSFEQWARTQGGHAQGNQFSFIGSTREVGPLLFETGQVHELLLWVTDRRGAEGRKVCRFEVVP